MTMTRSPPPPWKKDPKRAVKLAERQVEMPGEMGEVKEEASKRAKNRYMAGGQLSDSTRDTPAQERRDARGVENTAAMVVENTAAMVEAMARVMLV